MSTPPSGISAQESGFMKASQSTSLVKSRAHSSAIPESEELVVKDWLRKGAKCWCVGSCGAKGQAAEKRPRCERETCRTSWGDDLVGDGW